MRLDAGTLTASDAGARTLTYRLIPYGELGSTSLGRVVIHRGTLHAADLGAPLNLEHDPTHPVGVLSSFDDAMDALYATFTILPTRAGDDLLTEAAAGVRVGASVEVADTRITGHRVTGGRITGAAAVVRPAFPSALLTAAEVDAAHDPATCPTCGALTVTDGDETPVPADTESDDTPGDTPTEAPDPGSTPAEPDPATLPPNGDDPATTTDEDPAVPPVIEDEAPATATAPVLHASARPVSITDAAETAGAAMRAVAEGRDPHALLAALSDVTATAMANSQPQSWLGELWTETNVSRPTIESVVQGALGGTLKPPSGWRWNAAPAVANYTGDKADVPSNAPTLTAITSTLKRLAGAHDVDRAIFDLGDAELIAAYWREMSASYAALSEDYFSDLLEAGATDGTTAAGIVEASSAVDVIVGAALQVAAVKGARPTFIGVSTNLFAEFLTNPDASKLEFLTGSGGFDGSGSFGGVRLYLNPSLATDTVLAGDRQAARYFELPGSPIRAQAVNMPNGGIDVGVFGYAAGFITKPTAIVKIIRPSA